MKTFFWVAIVFAVTCLVYVVSQGIRELIRLFPGWIKKTDPFPVAACTILICFTAGLLSLASPLSDRNAAYLAGGFMILSIPMAVITHESVRLLQKLWGRQEKAVLPKAIAKLKGE